MASAFLIFIFNILLIKFSAIETVWDYTYCLNNGTSNSCADLLGNFTNGYTNTSQPKKRCICEVPVSITGYSNHAVTLFYGLKNYFQNHRRYVQSRWDPQFARFWNPSLLNSYIWVRNYYRGF